MKLLALSWAMPPLVYPRAIQVSRLLKALVMSGWDSTVVTLLPAADRQAVHDDDFAQIYAGCYQLAPVEPREDVLRSPLWLRTWRRYRAPADVSSANWQRRALAHLLQELQRTRYDACVTFAQPWVDHAIGLQLKRRRPQLPWIAHFSDPWVDNLYRPIGDARQERATGRLERAVVAAADALVFVNTETADLVMGKYPAALRDKVHIVTHGFDVDVCAHVHARPVPIAAPGLRIVYAGNLYPGKREPSALLQALATVRAETPDDFPLRLDFLGFAPPESVARMQALELADCVHFHGQVGYLDSLAVAAAADLLLVIDAPAERNVFLPSKVVDCLMLERPILGLTPANGPTFDLLTALGYPTVAPDLPDAIAQALRATLADWRAGRASVHAVPRTALARFDVKHTAQDFLRAIAYAQQRQGQPR